MRVVTLILFVVLILLQFKLWLGEGGFTEVARLETRVENQRQQNDDLLQRNAELQAEVEDLRDRLEAVETG
jgi:cell division protein FtsB